MCRRQKRGLKNPNIDQIRSIVQRLLYSTHRKRHSIKTFNSRAEYWPVQSSRINWQCSCDDNRSLRPLVCALLRRRFTNIITDRCCELAKSSCDFALGFHFADEGFYTPFYFSINRYLLPIFRFWGISFDSVDQILAVATCETKLSPF